MKIIKSSELTFTPASHENPLDPGVLKKVIMTRDDIPPGRLQMINWAKISPGKSFIRHYHEQMTEVFIIISGQGKIMLGEETASVVGGDTIILPVGVTQKMENTGKEDLVYITLGVVHAAGGRTIII